MDPAVMFVLEVYAESLPDGVGIVDVVNADFKCTDKLPRTFRSFGSFALWVSIAVKGLLIILIGTSDVAIYSSCVSRNDRPIARLLCRETETFSGII